MTWHFKIGLFTLGFLVATGIEAARADETFLCGPSKIVRVAAAELERMKREDACVAQHFGLTLAKPSEAKPADASPTTESPRPALRDLRAEPTARSARSEGARQRVAETATKPVVRAVEGTDFRNVPVLNATGPSAIYRHTR